MTCTLWDTIQRHQANSLNQPTGAAAIYRMPNVNRRMSR